MLERLTPGYSRTMTAPRRLRRIAVIGGGFTGVMAVIAIADMVKEPLEVVLFAADGPLAGGVAYGKARPGDSLNVRARDLSVHPDAGEDFAEWLAERRGIAIEGPAYDDVCESFAPRALYAEYVRQRLEQAKRRAPLMRLTIDRREAIDVVPARGGWYRVEAAAGEPVLAGVVVLATGYGHARPRFGLSPYDPTLGDGLAAAKTAVFVGSGLSMVDVLLWARREGWTGRADIISRHGFAPTSHAPVATRPPAYQTAGGTRLTRLTRSLRSAAALAAEEGRPWQGEMNRLRPYAQETWRGLSTADKARFMRHLRRLWDVHRHRLPAPIHAELSAELALDRTRVIRGRVIRVTGGDGPFTVESERLGDISRRTADLVIDCTGYTPGLHSPIVKSLVARGVAELDPLGLGLAVAPDGRVMPGRARGEPDLYALGPLGFGSLFEITAAPEIIRQARAAAATIRDLLDVDADPFADVWDMDAPLE